jgi:CubicO group peptidase (beta-lactamase class C family)
MRIAIPKGIPSKLLILCFFFVLASGAAAQQALPPKADSAIARFAEQIAMDVEEDGVGSIVAGVVLGSDLIWTRAFGWADRENKIPADIETIYRTGSISKSITAVVLAQLAERGVLNLDDPVEKYFPEINQLLGPLEGAAPITFRHLASHTAGLIREPKLPKAAAGPVEMWEEKILASIPTTEFQSAPGKKYSYSNIGFGILGMAISRAANHPFRDLVHDLIFTPLGMTSSTVVLTEKQWKHMSVGYANRDDSVNTELPALEHSGRGYKVPNGGVYSTVGDLARFIAGMTGSSPTQILSDVSRANMQRIQTPGDTTRGYGLGFFSRFEEDGFHIVGHGGSVAGYNAYVGFETNTRAGVILLRNYNRGRTRLSSVATGLLIKLVLSLKE